MHTTSNTTPCNNHITTSSHRSVNLGTTVIGYPDQPRIATASPALSYPDNPKPTSQSVHTIRGIVGFESVSHVNYLHLYISHHISSLSQNPVQMIGINQGSCPAYQ